MRPSFLGLIVSGFIILLAFILLLVNSTKIRVEYGIMITLLFAIAVSAHSLQHSVEEIFFRFNPLIGEWVPKDKPMGNGMASSCPCGRNCGCRGGMCNMAAKMAYA